MQRNTFARQRNNLQSRETQCKAEKSRETLCKAEKHSVKQRKAEKHFAKQSYKSASHFSALGPFSICFGSLANKRSLKAKIIRIICIICIIRLQRYYRTQWLRSSDGVSPTDIYDLAFHKRTKFLGLTSLSVIMIKYTGELKNFRAILLSIWIQIQKMWVLMCMVMMMTRGVDSEVGSVFCRWQWICAARQQQASSCKMSFFWIEQKKPS